MKNKILFSIGIILILLISFVGSAPYIFKSKLSELAKARLTNSLRAHVHFSDLDISWLRNFPKISVGLKNLQVVCVGEFDGDTLLTAGNFDLACNPIDFISGDSLRIYDISLDAPVVHAFIHKNGHRNWDIFQSEAGVGSGTKSLNWILQRYAIHQGNIRYEDEARDIRIEMTGLEQEGSGDLNSDLFTLKTKTTAEDIRYDYNGTIPYRLSAKTRIEVSLKVNRKTNTISFNTDRIAFNDLKLHSEGFFQWINDSSYNMDIHFKTPTTEFRNLLSLLSPVYQRDFATVKSTGLAVFNGFVKGKYNNSQTPAYHVNLDVENGFFQYPDLPEPVKNINLAVHIDNPDGVADHTLIDIRRGHFEINKEALDFHLLMRNPKTRPFIDMAFSGSMDLSNLSKFMKLDPGTRLNGLLSADIYAKGNVADIQKPGKEKFQAGGKFDLSKFLYVSDDYPGGIVLNEMLLTLNPRNAVISELRGQYLSTHFDATGTFNNLFDFAMKNNPLEASVHLKADEFNLRDWLGGAGDSAGALSRVHHTPSTFKVPADIRFTIQTELGKVHDDGLDMENLSGNLLIADETLHFDQVRADALEGTMIMNGSYSTKEGREHPEIAMTYDVQGMDIQKTFFAFNTLQKMMPVGRYMTGQFNSRVSMAGSLGEGMTPNLQSLHGEGNIQLVKAVLKDFEPVEKLARSLDIHGLKEIPMNDIKTDFTFESGKVVVNSFPVQTGDIGMEIFGTHGFDQSLAYGINLKIPRSQLGNKGTLFVKNVVIDAADKGIPVKLDETVNIYIRMEGTINDPEIKTDMNASVDRAAESLKKEVDDFVNAKLDSAKMQLHHTPSITKKEMVKNSKKTRSRTKSKKITATKHQQSAHTKSRRKKKISRRYYSSLSGKVQAMAVNRSKK